MVNVLLIDAVSDGVQQGSTMSSTSIYSPMTVSLAHSVLNFGQQLPMSSVSDVPKCKFLFLKLEIIFLNLLWTLSREWTPSVFLLPVLVLVRVVNPRTWMIRVKSVVL